MDRFIAALTSATLTKHVGEKNPLPNIDMLIDPTWALDVYFHGWFHLLRSVDTPFCTPDLNFHNFFKNWKIDKGQKKVRKTRKFNKIEKWKNKKNL